MSQKSNSGRTVHNVTPTLLLEPSIQLPDKPIVLERKFEDRWGDDLVVFSRGYSMVPNLFLQNYALLTPPLTASEAMFVLELMSYKYGKESPYPSYGAIAKCMNVSDKMVRRYAQSLEAKGYLTRVPRKFTTNKFDLNGLFSALYRIALGKRQNAIKQKGEVRTIT